jgi:hypothetical protein
MKQFTNRSYFFYRFDRFSKNGKRRTKIRKYIQILVFFIIIMEWFTNRLGGMERIKICKYV